MQNLFKIAQQEGHNQISPVMLRPLEKGILLSMGIT